MNDSNRRLLPPMAMLQSFAAAARLGSFSRAAGELALTQGAVSRQVAALEDWLGQTLFDRHGRRVTLNAAGRAYADAIAPALGDIRRATRSVLTPGAARALELATLPGFGMRWLAPRLPRFSAAHPDVSVNLTAQNEDIDLGSSDFDAVIHFGAPDRVGGEHHLLFHEQVGPVLAPEFAAAVRCPADLLSVPLLTLRSRPDAWHDWFALAGITDARVRVRAAHSQFLLLVQEVAAGGGAALIPGFLIESELATGALVQPFPIHLTSSHGYYLVHRPGPVCDALARFRGWLQQEINAPG
ncbi:MAG: LysR family transcriptional regulator [Blastomonas sp. CACIA14H2]|uniref:LysR substrate-binding domain-containing protein n=1 Tax=Blastomonas sp. CACIA14H2 TaxID=1419876 RepID=UPI0003D01BFD|nr:MAG: LysR family transcriptional regulator [Blastomonas sp. CACIA14H2]